MSITWRLAPRSSASARFSRRPVERSSITVTSSPRATSASTRFEPMNPAPPVTSARMGGGMLGHATATAFAAGTVARVAGLFVTFEGIDRSGKTTQARMLCEALGNQALAVREPGGTAVGERVRDLLKEPHVEIAPHAEALLFAAARSELCRQVIRPALEQGRAVIEGTEDHPHARAVLAAAVGADATPSHAYLFHGPPGTGKRTAARALAAELLAEREPDPDAARARVLAGTHPDLTWVRPTGAH